MQRHGSQDRLARSGDAVYQLGGGEEGLAATVSIVLQTISFRLSRNSFHLIQRTICPLPGPTTTATCTLKSSVATHHAAVT